MTVPDEYTIHTHHELGTCGDWCPAWNGDKADPDLREFGFPAIGVLNDFPMHAPPLRPAPKAVQAAAVFPKAVPEVRVVINYDLQITVRDGEVSIDYGDKGITCPMTTDEAHVIAGKLMPVFLELFLEKNRKYASVQDGHDLGAEGIIPDVNRKMGILIDRLWHGNPTVGEDSKEVILDMIGHLFLMLYKLEDG